MEQTAITLIVVTLLILGIILGLLTFLVFKIVNQKNTLPEKQPANPSSDSHPSLSRTEFHPSILDRMKEMESFKIKRTDLFCPIHPDEPGETSCAICDKIFCSSCIRPFKSFHACKEHLPLLMHNEWEEVLTLKTSTTDPERGVKLYDFKKELFENEHIPTYIETHYKINVDQDYIETYLVLIGVTKDLNRIKNHLVTKNFTIG